MNGNIASVGSSVISAGVSGNCFSRAMKATADQSLHFFVGLAVLFGLWWLAIYVITLDPSNSTFSDAPLAIAVLAGFVG
jgi:NitT/TauT family transport system permease protein